jgi:hypothetical protein
VFDSAEGEQTEKCDVTVSPNTESPSETGDSDGDPNFSLGDDSCSGTSDSNSSSLHEVSGSALNEPQNVDLTAERDKTGTKEQIKKKSRGIRMGRNKTSYYETQDTHTETLKDVLKILKGRYVPLWGHLYTEIFT